MPGSKPGERRGGRQRGAKNKRTLALEQAQAEASVKIEATLGADAFQGDAHALLSSVYKARRSPLACVSTRQRPPSAMRSLASPPSTAGSIQPCRGRRSLRRPSAGG